MRTTINNKAFTFIELIVAVAITVLLMTGVYGFYNAASQSYSSGISGQTLQDGADIVLSKIIEGETESGAVYRLSTAVSYMIPNGTANALYTCGGAPQAAPCNTGDNNSNTFVELYYCQDNPCSATDSSARWYYLNSTGTAVMYHYPGEIQDTAIYTAPKGSALTLRFSPAQYNSLTIPNVVEIDVALRQNLSAATVVTNTRLSTTSGSGAASTFVLLRNHP
jgi:prepilin-type N-terminal cleavage/methylation domain-containing protein